MREGGEIISAHDECLGGYDGACRYVAAGLFEVERSLRENTLKPSPTEGPCKWKKRTEVNTDPETVKQLKIQRTAQNGRARDGSILTKYEASLLQGRQK